MTADADQTARSSALFPKAVDRRRLDDALTHQLAEAHARVSAGSVTPMVDLNRFQAELAAFDFKAGQPLDASLAWVMVQLENGIVHLTNPRYFGLFNPAPTFPAQCADRIAAVFNPQLATATTSPVAVAVEAHVIAMVAARAGLPPTAAGHFTAGGSEANGTALACALTRARPDFGTEGVRAFPGRPLFYVSKESHLAWLKIAHLAGIGRAAVRLVDTNGHGQMDPTALATAIATDQAEGNVPVMVAATAGTTNAGMIDPLHACAEIARAADVWFHVDAAWGGALIASERSAVILAGIEAADSITIDAHKWFATTMGCGMFITRHANLLSATFRVSTSYMPSNNAHVDPYVTTAQWSRRFLGLRLFLSLATAGWDGYAEHVERARSLTDLLKGELLERGWEIVNNSELAVLCFLPPARSATPEAIVRSVVSSGRAWISKAVYEGQDVIRACVTHGEATKSDVAALVEALEAAAVATT